MPTKLDTNNAVQDGIVISSLISAPAWAPWLSDLNEVLTTATLVLGLVLGLARLWVFIRQNMRDRRGPGQ